MPPRGKSVLNLISVAKEIIAPYENPPNKILEGFLSGNLSISY